MKSKKIFLATILAAFTTISIQAQSTLTKLWETDAIIQVPESVLYSAKNKLLYVAQIDGQAGEKDGKGGIAKVGLDGKIIDLNWVTGLDAPKGMAVIGNKLYVADINDVVEIDTKSGKVTKRIPVEGSKFLNDITIDAKGNIYVSDTQTAKIHLISKGVVTTHLENLTRPNGLLAVGTDLLIADSGELKRLTTGKKLSTIAKGMEKSSDGIEQIVPGEYIVSNWIGVVYHVKSDGTVTTLLDTRNEKINSADIGYDSVKKIVYIPTFLKNSVVAYQLK